MLTFLSPCLYGCLLYICSWTLHPDFVHFIPINFQLSPMYFSQLICHVVMSNSFLFKLTHSCQTIPYRWTGKNKYFALCEADFMSFGGGWEIMFFFFIMQLTDSVVLEPMVLSLIPHSPTIPLQPVLLTTMIFSVNLSLWSPNMLCHSSVWAWRSGVHHEWEFGK